MMVSGLFIMHLSIMSTGKFEPLKSHLVSAM